MLEGSKESETVFFFFFFFKVPVDLVTFIEEICNGKLDFFVQRQIQRLRVLTERFDFV